MVGKVFISHASADKDFAVKLANDLGRRGVASWLAVRDIPKGPKWHKEIEKALRSCTRMVLVLSPGALESEEIDNEWTWWVDKERPLLVLIRRACDPPFQLNRRQRVDMTGGYASGLDDVDKWCGGSPKRTERTGVVREIGDEQITAFGTGRARSAWTPSTSAVPSLSAPLLTVKHSRFGTLLRWSPVAGASEYVVESAMLVAGGWGGIYRGDKLSHIVSTILFLSMNTAYRVKALGPDGSESAWSLEVAGPE